MANSDTAYGLNNKINRIITERWEKEEGYTKFTKEQFVLFVEQIKKGTFDGYFKKH